MAKQTWNLFHVILSQGHHRKPRTWQALNEQREHKSKRTVWFHFHGDITLTSTYKLYTILLWAKPETVIRSLVQADIHAWILEQTQNQSPNPSDHNPMVLVFYMSREHLILVMFGVLRIKHSFNSAINLSSSLKMMHCMAIQSLHGE